MHDTLRKQTVIVAVVSAVKLLFPEVDKGEGPDQQVSTHLRHSEPLLCRYTQRLELLFFQ